MTGVNMGMNMKYLPWQLFVPIVLVLSVICVYGTVTLKDKSKLGNIFLICMAIFGFLLGIEKLAIHTGILSEYLPFLGPISYIFLFIGLFMVFLGYFWD